ncbi:MAG: sulfur carrier protein ThiS [Succinivibrio sp.]|jgi:thiamine biosynthesis protein ThiS|nr:sulfur carrier protein ThiS [Succinivibrio sp.]
MRVTFNGKEDEAADNTTLLDFITAKGIKAEGSAAACDGDVVPKKEWGSFKLKEGMSIDVFNLVAGG